MVVVMMTMPIVRVSNLRSLWSIGITITILKVAIMLSMRVITIVLIRTTLVAHRLPWSCGQKLSSAE